MRALTLVFFAIAGCGGGGGSGGDMAVVKDMTAKAGDMAVLSQCGHPGDTGNSLGVGKFCTTIAECQVGNMKTNICSSLGNAPDPSPDDTYFCTIYPCHLDGGMAECGEDATCTCGSGGGLSGPACPPNRRPG